MGKESDEDDSLLDDDPDDKKMKLKEPKKDNSGDIDYILTWSISDSLRQILILVLLVANFLSANLAVTFMILSWYVRSTLETQVTFLEHFYQPNAVPSVLFIAGLIKSASSLLGIRAAIGGRLIEDKRKAKLAANYFFINWILASITVFFIIVTTFVCLLEIRQLEEALGKGLKAAMEVYRTDILAKSEIDMLQMDYRCCGVESYKDWFNISWVDVKYLNVQDSTVKKSLRNGLYYGKDVPFSCCQWSVLRPCVDTRVEDNSYNNKYDFKKDLTLYTMGCKEAVTNFLGFTVFKGVGLFVVSCFILWIAMAVVTRYLHTSLVQVSQGKAPVGWIVPYSMKSQPPRKARVQAESSQETVLSMDEDLV